MKYFKILVNNVIIGVVTSNEFMRYLPITDCFVRATEQNGEYVTYKGKFYRATWMTPMTQQVDYIDALIIDITKEEYDVLKAAIDNNEQIPPQDDDDEQEEETPTPIPYVDPIDAETLEFVRTSKINEMSQKCRKTIEQGFDIIIRDKTSHFSLTTEDQLNLVNLNEMAKTQDLIPYHADGESVVFYTKEEFNSIISAANSLKIYQTTYYNALKDYINSLETIEEIAAIYYGIEIPQEFKTEVLKVLEYN